MGDRARTRLYRAAGGLLSCCNYGRHEDACSGGDDAAYKPPCSCREKSADHTCSRYGTSRALNAVGALLVLPCPNEIQGFNERCYSTFFIGVDFSLRRPIFRATDQRLTRTALWPSTSTKLTGLAPARGLERSQDGSEPRTFRACDIGAKRQYRVLVLDEVDVLGLPKRERPCLRGSFVVKQSNTEGWVNDT